MTKYQGAVEWVAANTVASVSDNPPYPTARWPTSE